MIGIFLGDVRIGSILHFPHQKYWAAYAMNGAKAQHKTRKAAIAWLTEQHEVTA